MKESPFIFGKTVSTLAFTDRVEDAAKLYSNLVNGINTMLLSPRRWGKSSLVEKVACDIRRKEKGVRVAMIDMFMVSNKEEFLEIFAKEVLKATSSKVDDIINGIKGFFKHLTPKIGFDIDSNEFTLAFDRSELEKHSDEILNLPEVIAKKKGVKLIVCIDEFQDLTSFSDYDAFEKKMRAVWQRQKCVTYCLYGSKRHMMTDIFNNSAKPFYRFGDVMMLQKISRDKWVEFLIDSFAATKKSISHDNACRIADLMKNHSWYVQQFANYIWNKTPRVVNAPIIASALNELVSSSIPFFIRELEVLSTTQLSFLKAVAAGETALSSVAVMAKFQLGTSANVRKNKVLLTQKDILNFENDEYEFLDPVFELWFKKKFFGVDFLDLL